MQKAVLRKTGEDSFVVHKEEALLVTMVNECECGTDSLPSSQQGVILLTLAPIRIDSHSHFHPKRTDTNATWRGWRISFQKIADCLRAHGGVGRDQVSVGEGSTMGENVE